jgi:8-hydroxy-5-deazaflavin:NADPH oxidoreductase
MDVGIIGAGRLGQAMARAGRSVAIANSRGPESLAAVVSALGEGVSAGSVGDAASADIVVIAVSWDCVSAAVQGLDWNGQIVVDATNDFAADDLGWENIERSPRRPCCRRAGRQGREHPERRSARLGSPRIRRSARDLHLWRRRRRESGRRGLFQDAGFAAIDLGDLATGGAMQQIHHPLAGVNLVRL